MNCLLKLDSDVVKGELLKAVEEEIERLWGWLQEALDRRTSIIQMMTVKPEKDLSNIAKQINVSTQTDENDEEVFKDMKDETEEMTEWLDESTGDDVKTPDESVATCDMGIEFEDTDTKYEDLYGQNIEALENEDIDTTGSSVIRVIGVVTGEELNNLEAKLDSEIYQEDNVSKVISDSDNDSTSSVKLGTQSLTCDMCGAVYTEKSYLLLHILQHLETSLECIECGQVFQTPEEFELHSHENPELQQCFLCGEYADNENGMIEHFKYAHDYDDVAAKSLVKFRCPICNRQFDHMGRLDIHMRVHEKYRYPCGVCNSLFLEKRQQQKHIRKWHPELLNYHCDLCKCKFADIADLTEHKMMRHEHKKFACGICKKSLATRWRLRLHQMTVHSNEICVCDICGKTSRHRLSLQAHLKKHLQPPDSFSCQFCGKIYQSQTGLTYHLKDHSGENGATCELCGKLCKNTYVLSIHQRLHTGNRPFKCTICDASYTVSLGLKKHMATHTGMKEYECVYCSRKFITNYQLKTHIRKHTGEKPYLCAKCGMTYTSNSAVYKHRKKCKALIASLALAKQNDLVHMKEPETAQILAE